VDCDDFVVRVNAFFHDAFLHSLAVAKGGGP